MTGNFTLFVCIAGNETNRYCIIIVYQDLEQRENREQDYLHVLKNILIKTNRGHNESSKLFLRSTSV